MLQLSSNESVVLISPRLAYGETTASHPIHVPHERCPNLYYDLLPKGSIYLLSPRARVQPVAGPCSGSDKPVAQRWARISFSATARKP